MQGMNLKPILNTYDVTLIIDGRYLCYRTKYSKGGKLSYNNEDTSVYYGFFNILQALANNFMARNTVIMWDISKYGVRNDEFDGYKQRDKKLLTDKEKKEKIEFENIYLNLIEICKTLGFVNYSLPMYEADDLIALWCKQFSNATNIIVTRDEDMYQLINKNTFVYDPDKKIKKNLKWFKNTYGIEPEQWIDYKAIAGCKSDTVPGISGMGPVKTLEYLKGDPKWDDIVLENDAIYELCRKLVILPHSSLKNHWLPYKETHLNEEEFSNFCFKYNLLSFIEKIHNFYIFT